MSEYTPGLLAVDGSNIQCGTGHNVAIAFDPDNQMQLNATCKANAARLVACWNALASFPDPERDVAELVLALRNLITGSQVVQDSWDQADAYRMYREAMDAASAILARIAPSERNV
jgi:hypothetical protein